MTKTEKYDLGFTIGSLMVPETEKMALKYFELGSWDSLRKNAIDENLLQFRIKEAGKKKVKAIAGRLSLLSPEELVLFKTGTNDEKAAIIWVAICKKHKIIREFAQDVMREKFLSMNFDIKSNDFETLLNNKSDWHPEVKSLTDGTVKKLSQVILKMMKDCGFIDGESKIIQYFPSPGFVGALKDKAFLSIFPIRNEDIERLTND